MLIIARNIIALSIRHLNNSRMSQELLKKYTIILESKTVVADFPDKVT